MHLNIPIVCKFSDTPATPEHAQPVFKPVFLLSQRTPHPAAHHTRGMGAVSGVML